MKNEQVLILLPLRSTAEKFVKSLIELAPKAQAVGNYPSFYILYLSYFLIDF